MVERAGASRGRNDELVDAAPLRSRAAGRFADLFDEEPDAEKLAALRAAECIGRPLGSEAFLDRLAALMGRNPRPGKPGRRPKTRCVRNNPKLKKVSPYSVSREFGRTMTATSWQIRVRSALGASGGEPAPASLEGLSRRENN